MSATAIITGAGGQDASYLAELLLAKGYTVVGITRRQSSEAALWRIAHLRGNPRYILECADMCDQTSLDRVVAKHEPTEVYNLAAQSFVPASWEQPVYTGDVDALGVTRILEAVRRYSPRARVVQASSSEIFGDSPPPQREDTPLRPRSPYGVAKCYGYFIARNYRESYGMHVSNAISFNHGSPRRGPEFVEQKVATEVARIAFEIERAGLIRPMRLGNMDAARDWLHASDVVRAMWMMAQTDVPDDYVVASGDTHTIHELVAVACRAARLGEDIGRFVETDATLLRPAEVPALHGDASKIKAALGWQPEVTFQEMIWEMVAAAAQRIGK